MIIYFIRNKSSEQVVDSANRISFEQEKIISVNANIQVTNLDLFSVSVYNLNLI